MNKARQLVIERLAYELYRTVETPHKPATFREWKEWTAARQNAMAGAARVLELLELGLMESGDSIETAETRAVQYLADGISIARIMRNERD